MIDYYQPLSDLKLLKDTEPDLETSPVAEPDLETSPVAEPKPFTRPELNLGRNAREANGPKKGEDQPVPTPQPKPNAPGNPGNPGDTPKRGEAPLPGPTKG